MGSTSVTYDFRRISPIVRDRSGAALKALPALLWLVAVLWSSVAVEASETIPSARVATNRAVILQRPEVRREPARQTAVYLIAAALLLAAGAWAIGPRIKLIRIIIGRDDLRPQLGSHIICARCTAAMRGPR